MRYVRGLFVPLLALIIVTLSASAGVAAPEGQMTWAVDISLAPGWFDPADTSGIVTPWLVLYALHDAMVKPMPGKAMAPSLAESWSVTPDGLVYEFRLAKGGEVPQRRPSRRGGCEVLSSGATGALPPRR